MTDEDIYEKANQKVKAKKGFFYHFIAYVFSIAMLYAIMHFEKEGQLLPVVIVALGWGIGIATHYFKTFGTENLDSLGLDPDWEEEALEDEIEKLKRKRALKEELQKERNLLADAERLELKQIEKRRLEKD
ncbi:MAG: 2TM domain-containing protein [Saprospiraceae bacterium]